MSRIPERYCYNIPLVPEGKDLGAFEALNDFMKSVEERVEKGEGLYIWSESNYGHEGEISVIEPFYLKECRSKEPWKYNAWVEACCKAEDRYLCLLEWGASPQEARAVLPNSLKTEIVVTANLREWRNIDACKDISQFQ